MNMNRPVSKWKICEKEILTRLFLTYDSVSSYAYFFLPSCFAFFKGRHNVKH
jgi:hypothetical protein